jgi:hypothetical protein
MALVCPSISNTRVCLSVHSLMCGDDTMTIKGMIKAGFGGDDAPRAVFPSIVGRPRHTAAAAAVAAANTKAVWQSHNQ